MDLVPGTTLGVYVVRSLIGVGGMGEVYRAHDTRLDRDVAIKVLPRSLTTSEDRLARFEREARTLATLNHPNIATIYGLEVVDEVRAIVMELVEGETLAERLGAGATSQSRHALSLGESLAIARQIADALDAAHEKGIVHRDLKPANLKVGSSGAVKVLDFGLAKAAAEGSAVNLTDSPTVMGTSLGVILGTAPYMSPEQARGHAVDKRTDIWAFGCVLFEMLTGTPAFLRATVSDTIVAILEREPDWTALPKSTPAAVTSLLHRCLEKDPRLRLRDIGDVRHLIDQPGDQQLVARDEKRPTSSTWWLIPAGVALLGLAGTAWRFSAGPADAVNPLANAVFTRLTDFPGSENDASISRDGKWVAFRSDRDGPEDTWVSQVGTGQFLNLTRGTQSHVLIRNQGFTPDGSQVWLSGVIGGTHLRSVPLTGGAAKPLLTEHAMNVAWSPDGSKVAFHTYDPGDPIFVGDAVGAELPEVYKLSPGGHNHYLTWSADGRWIYFVSGVWDARAMDIWRMPASGKPVERLTQDNRDITHLSVLNDRTLLYIAPDERGEGPWLWALDLPTRTTRRVSSGLERYTSVDAAGDGRVVVSVSNPTANLWTMPLSDQRITEKEVTQLNVPTARAFGPRYGGKNLFYLSARGGGDGLWRFADGQVAEVWKGSDAALLEPPAVSVDGGRVAIVVRRQGKSSLLTMSSEGGDLKALAPAIVVSGTPSWSPDGRWIVASGSENNVPGLFKIPVDGGEPVRLLQGAATNPVWSPSGSVIVYSAPAVGYTQPLRMIHADGSPAEAPSISVKVLGERYRFVPGRDQLVYIRGGSQSVTETFWLLDLDTGKSRELSAFDARDTRTFDITPDGKQIVFDRLRDNSDIVLIDLASK